MMGNVNRYTNITITSDGISMGNIMYLVIISIGILVVLLINN